VKVIRFIFTLYITFVTVYPCSDGNTCLDEQKAGITVVNESTHEHGSSERDLCTPFCICSCCAAQVQISSLAYQEFLTFEHNTKQLALYFERPISNTSHSIWQPPKIS
jgi:hypothetical protein